MHQFPSTCVWRRIPSCIVHQNWYFAPQCGKPSQSSNLMQLEILKFACQASPQLPALSAPHGRQVERPVPRPSHAGDVGGVAPWQGFPRFKGCVMRADVRDQSLRRGNVVQLEPAGWDPAKHPSQCCDPDSSGPHPGVYLCSCQQEFGRRRRNPIWVVQTQLALQRGARGAGMLAAAPAAAAATGHVVGLSCLKMPEHRARDMRILRTSHRHDGGCGGAGGGSGV